MEYYHFLMLSAIWVKISYFCQVEMLELWCVGSWDSTWEEGQFCTRPVSYILSLCMWYQSLWRQHTGTVVWPITACFYVTGFVLTVSCGSFQDSSAFLALCLQSGLQHFSVLLNCLSQFAPSSLLLLLDFKSLLWFYTDRAVATMVTI